VQLHQAPLKQLTHSVIQKLVSNLGELNNPTLEGYERWDRYIRIRIQIDPTKPLRDRICFTLPRGEEVTSLIHYERVPKICLFYAKLGHKTAECESRIILVSRIKEFPPKMHDSLQNKLKPSMGGWINKACLLPTGPADL
jgi:hypothetical protein